MQARTVVILGGGVGGVVAARELRRRLPRPHRIVLIDREREHLFAPSLLWLMVGQRDAVSIRRPLARLGRKGIEVRIAEVEHVDAASRRVTLGSGETLDADYLVISLGAALDPAAIPDSRRRATTSTRYRGLRPSETRCARCAPAASSC